MRTSEIFKAPGIYIDMPESEYLADPSIGASSLKLCVGETQEWWWASQFNPNRPEREETNATNFGTALHKMLLEGTQAYEATYGLAFDKSEHKAALDTIDQLKAHLKTLGLKVSGNKPDLIERIRTEDSEVEILAELEIAHNKALGTRDTINPDWDHTIRVIKRIAERDPEIAKIFDEGLPEVSVFWIRMSADV